MALKPLLLDWSLPTLLFLDSLGAQFIPSPHLGQLPALFSACHGQLPRDCKQNTACAGTPLKLFPMWSSSDFGPFWQHESQSHSLSFGWSCLHSVHSRHGSTSGSLEAIHTLTCWPGFWHFPRKAPSEAPTTPKPLPLQEDMLVNHYERWMLPLLLIGLLNWVSVFFNKALRTSGSFLHSARISQISSSDWSSR